MYTIGDICGWMVQIVSRYPKVPVSVNCLWLYTLGVPAVPAWTCAQAMRAHNRWSHTVMQPVLCAMSLHQTLGYNWACSTDWWTLFPQT